MAFKKLTTDERNYWSSRVEKVFVQYKNKVADSIDIKQTSFEDVKEEYFAELMERFKKECDTLTESNFNGARIYLCAPTLKELGKDESYNRCMKIKEICRPMKERKDKILLMISNCQTQEEFDEIIDFVKECRDYVSE